MKGDYNVNTLEETYEGKSLIQDFTNIIFIALLSQINHPS